MKKFLMSLCIVLALAACKDENKANEQANTKPVVKIGVILPLSGANSYMGEQMREGYEFVREYSRPDVNYQLIYVDDQQSSSKAAVAAKKLIEVDKVDALLTGTSQTASVVADAAEKAKIIHLGISSDDRFTQKAYNYTMAPDSVDESVTLLKYLQEQGYRKIALITANEVFADLVDENMHKLAEQYGMKIVFNEKITPGATNDYRLMLRKAVQSEPDIFLLQSWPPEIDILTKQLLEIAPQAKITSLYSFFISSSPELYKGRFGLNVGSNNQEFKTAFYQKYGKKLEQMSATAYAQLSLMLDILQNKNNELNKTVEANDSIFGHLTMDNRSIRYQPIVETIEE
ncbi:MAG: penicillin-binding protein activator [Alphaproteobacteria bacterium]|nr:penicillin-binding protein activator [Alphaproteobacteria bacterium]